MSEFAIKKEGEEYCTLGSLLFYGIEGFPKNTNKAIAAWRMASVRGSSLAQYNLGIIFKVGTDEITKNVSYGNYQLIKSAFRGNADALKIIRDEQNATASLASFEFDSAVDYGKPQLGVSLRFYGAATKFDEYHFDLGLNNLTTGITDPSFADVYLSTKNDFTANKGLIEGETVVSISGVDFRLIYGTHTTENEKRNTFSYIAAVNGELLKFRVSYLENPSESDIENYQKFIASRVEIQKNSEPYSPGMYIDSAFAEALPKYSDAENTLKVFEEMGRQMFRSFNQDDKKDGEF